MGACYSVYLTIKTKDAAATVAAIKKYMEENPREAVFSLGEWSKHGVGTESLDDLVRIMLAGWPGLAFMKEDEPHGFTTYRNEFNASYGWQMVMEGMFEAMGPTLENGSEFFIEADSSRVTYTVEDGEVY